MQGRWIQQLTQAHKNAARQAKVVKPLPIRVRLRLIDSLYKLIFIAFPY